MMILQKTHHAKKHNPTSRCISPEAYFSAAIIKSLAVGWMIDQDPEHVAWKMVDEAAGRAIRLAGSGEILPSHRTLVDYIENRGGQVWGFTRRIDTQQVLPGLMFSFDATTPEEVVAYISENVPVHRRAYLRRPEDSVPGMDVAVTFRVHGAQTNYLRKTPREETDCPAVDGKVSGCWACGRCY